LASVVDSDLEESIAALKASLESAQEPCSLGAADPEQLQRLQERFGLPRRYVEFLAECDPLELAVATPAEHVELIPAADLEEEQRGFCLDEDDKRITTPAKNGWRPSWIIIARSGLGDPYFLDVSNIDAEGDCPVFTAMSGTDTWQQTLCASSFAMFVRILAITMDVAEDFDMDDYDPDNERVFREAVGPRIREVDPAAVKGGHWT
jgi:hypothetical protein